MGTTGKKFVVALSVLAVLLGLGWWLLQEQSVKVSGTLPGTVPDTALLPEAAAPIINPNEPMVDPALLREVSVSLRLAADSLAMGKDPQPALEMIKTLEARLATTASPTRISALRAALAADHQRIAQAQRPDFAAMQAALKRMQGQVDSLPNLFVPHSGAAAPALPVEAGNATVVAETYWGRMMNAFGEKLGEVVKVRRVEDRKSSFRTPEQGRLLTEQLRFRIESANVALEMRNSQRFSSELGHAQAILAQAFDADHPSVVAFRASLIELQRQSPGLSLPTPQSSMDALARLIAGGLQ